MSQQDLHEAEQIQSHGLSAHERGVALDDPALFELAYALLQARGRQLQPAGQLHAGDPGIVLQVPQQPPVQVVEGTPARLPRWGPRQRRPPGDGGRGFVRLLRIGTLTSSAYGGTSLGP